MVHTHNDPSETFASSRAPYIDYLAAIKGSWNEAGVFEAELRKLVEGVNNFEKPIHPDYRGGPCTNVAEILDVITGPNGKLCIPTDRPTLTASRILPDKVAVKNFVDRLHTCGSNVNTRIIILNSARQLPDKEAADKLFFCHLLGAELDLPLTDVRIISQVGNLSDPTLPLARWPYCRPMKPGFISLGPSKGSNQKRTLAAYVGRKQFGSFSPHVGQCTSKQLVTSASLSLSVNDCQWLFTYRALIVNWNTQSVLLSAACGSLHQTHTGHRELRRGCLSLHRSRTLSAHLVSPCN